MTIRAANIPIVIGNEIFSFLELKNLDQVELVCKNWHKITEKDLLWIRLGFKKHFSSLAIIDKNHWEALGLKKITDEPIPNKFMVKALRKLFANLPTQVTGTLLTIPKGLSLNKLRQHASAPKNGYPITIHYGCTDLAEKYGDICVGRTHRVFITNEIVRHIDTYRKGLGCKDGYALIGAVLLVLTHFSSSNLNALKKLFSNHYMRCSEVNGEEILVGNLRVFKDQRSFHIIHKSCFMVSDRRVDLKDTFNFLQTDCGPVVMREF